MHPPGRLLAEQAAKVLGFKKHEILMLVRANLLKPIGNPPRLGVKYFFVSEIETLARDREWMARATRAIYRYWFVQNQKRRQKTRVHPDAHRPSEIQPAACEG
jgi:hypothetical protein